MAYRQRHLALIHQIWISWIVLLVPLTNRSFLNGSSSATWPSDVGFFNCACKSFISSMHQHCFLKKLASCKIEEATASIRQIFFSSIWKAIVCQHAVFLLFGKGKPSGSCHISFDFCTLIYRTNIGIECRSHLSLGAVVFMHPHFYCCSLCWFGNSGRGDVVVFAVR